MAYVYILECRGGTLYTGYTTDINRRLEQHQLGRASKYTRTRLPVKLVYLEVVDSKSAALKREISIKKLSHMEKQALITNKRNLV